MLIVCSSRRRWNAVLVRKERTFALWHIRRSVEVLFRRFRFLDRGGCIVCDMCIYKLFWTIVSALFASLWFLGGCDDEKVVAVTGTVLD